MPAPDRTATASSCSTVHAAFRGVAARPPATPSSSCAECGHRADLRHRRRRDQLARGRPPRSSGCARATPQAGYGHGHRVGLLLENRPAFFTHWLALNALGASVVPINAELQSAELGLPDRPQRHRAWRSCCRAAAPTCARPPRGGGVPLAMHDGVPTRGGRRRIRAGRRAPALRAAPTRQPSAATPSAPCSTPRARPAGRRAAARNGYFLSVGRWYSASAACRGARTTSSASSRRCR